jgi:Tol biopolymer transport system component
MTRPAWSPDGRRIAFVYAGGIGVIDADGRNVRHFPPLGDPVANLAWSPDEDVLAFNTCCDEYEYGGGVLSPLISMVRLEDEGLVSVGPTGITGYYPAWVRGR